MSRLSTSQVPDVLGRGLSGYPVWNEAPTQRYGISGRDKEPEDTTGILRGGNVPRMLEVIEAKEIDGGTAIHLSGGLDHVRHSAVYEVVQLGKARPQCAVSFLRAVGIFPVGSASPHLFPHRSSHARHLIPIPRPCNDTPLLNTLVPALILLFFFVASTPPPSKAIAADCSVSCLSSALAPTPPSPLQQSRSISRSLIISVIAPDTLHCSRNHPPRLGSVACILQHVR
ncbi:hypothetical protein B0O80DRAFT_45408 [Mortierella sp. GBAus27b]|nr:hypothetical protein B0O80DRAFT_45408 [Mortierella sp. GBAus27b]